MALPPPDDETPAAFLIDKFLSPGAERLTGFLPPWYNKSWYIPGIRMRNALRSDGEAMKQRSIKAFLCTLCAAVPLQGVKRADMAQTVFAGIMNEEENPTMLDLTSLDQGFYLAAGITPSCRYFANNNLNTREKREALDEYLAQGRTMFVVSRWEDPGEHYALIAEHTSPFDLCDMRAYKLYRRVE